MDSDSDFMQSLSSEDELEMQVFVIKKRNKNYLEEIVPQYDGTEFCEHFRISRELAQGISSQFQRSELHKRHYGQHGKLSAFHQILIFLWYIGHQTSSFRDVADRFDISISSLHRVIKRVAIFVSNLSPQVIVWPTEHEKSLSAEHFLVNGFPNTIGAIDGTHIRIDKPQSDPDSYINRKGFYSIQVQAVVDHNRKFIDIFIGYPGSVHDSRVFRISPLGNNLEEKCGPYYLLGDSGYPLKSHLMTPFKDRGNLTPHQTNYNVKLSKNRYIVEHAFGILKQKFRQMYHIKLRSIFLICNLIRTACVLHNIAIYDEFTLSLEANIPDNPLQLEDAIHNEDGEDNDTDAKRIRDNLANSLPF